ncbi:MAG TPA: hypothetical protein VEY91_10410 [Candidatus Limnocylindria bacterium]|nr:hypothetical protein [Candidatus Limnocylindria bacterium]
MRRFLVVCLLALLGVELAAPAFAARRVVVRKGPRHRTTVVVHRGWPIRRPARVVVVRPARVAVRVRPAVYVSTIVFTGAVVAATASPAHDVLAWEDGETLEKADDWTEFTLNCDSRGTKLWLRIVDGKVQADWAEVVFENGEARVVDFQERTHGPGMYSLLDFKSGRKVDHVRMVARAKSSDARIVLRMEK